MLNYYDYVHAALTLEFNMPAHSRSHAGWDHNVLGRHGSASTYVGMARKQNGGTMEVLVFWQYFIVVNSTRQTLRSESGVAPNST